MYSSRKSLPIPEVKGRQMMSSFSAHKCLIQSSDATLISFLKKWCGMLAAASVDLRRSLFRESSSMPHYFFRKNDQFFFSGEIMRHRSASPQHSWCRTVFGSLRAPHYSCQKKWELSLLGRSTAPTHQRHPTSCQASPCMPASSQQRLTISSTKLQAFSWNDDAPEHLFHQQVPDYFFRKNDHFFLKK